MWLFFFFQFLDGQLLRRERQGHRKSATLTLLSTNLSSGHQVGTRGGQQGQQAVQPPLALLPSPIPPSGRKEEQGCPSTPYPPPFAPAALDNECCFTLMTQRLCSINKPFPGTGMQWQIRLWSVHAPSYILSGDKRKQTSALPLSFSAMLIFEN